MLGELGCGVYDAGILTRGGREWIASVPWHALEWERVLDETSAARVRAVATPDCCGALAEVRPWRHELGVYRDGALAWIGPVGRISWTPEEVAIEARDLTAWWDRRRVHQDHSYAVTDLATIFAAIAADAMAPDPSPGLTVTVSPSGVLGTREVLALQHQIAGQVLRELTDTGIDWTAIVRIVLAGGAAVPVAALGTFLDRHLLSSPTVVVDGQEQANDWIVRGQGGGAAGDDVFGTATAASATLAADGRLEAVATASEIKDSPSATEQARGRLALTGEPAVSVEGCVLSPEAPFDLAALVPGAACRLELAETCVPVSGDFRLQRVAVAAGGEQTETVTLYFQPAGGA